MAITEQTPLRKALVEKLGPDKEELIKVCAEAVALGQAGANGDYNLFGRVLELPNGRKLTVEQVITGYHLNDLIDWGGGEVI